MAESILPYFEQQLHLLQQEFNRFARQHPNAAQEIGLSGDKITDPQIQRLLEGCAFLNANIEQRLDDHYPQFVDNFLAFYFPHLLRTTPAICQVQFIPNKGLLNRQILKSGSEFITKNKEGEDIKWKTTSDVVLYPLALTQSNCYSAPFFDNQDNAIEQANGSIVLSFSLLDKGLKFSEIELNCLDFQLKGDNQNLWRLYDLLALDVVQIELVVGNKKHKLGKKALTPKGFIQNYALDYHFLHHPNWALLNESFLLAERFRVFNVDFSGCLLDSDANEFSLHIYIKQWPATITQAVSQGCFALYCVPMVNIFSYISEPIEIDFQRASYPLNIDTNERLFLYSIDKISDITEDKIKIVPRLYRENTHIIGDTENRYSELRWSLKSHTDEAQIKLQVTDLGQQSLSLVKRIWLAETQVTQGQRAHNITQNVSFECLESINLPADIQLLYRPQTAKRLQSSAYLTLPLLAHLHANLAALFSHPSPARLLQQWLSMYDRQHNQQMTMLIESIIDVRHETCVAPIRISQQSLHVCGHKIVVTLHLDHYLGGVALLCQLLDRFFAGFVDDTSFTQLHVTVEGEQVRNISFPRRMGGQE